MELNPFPIDQNLFDLEIDPTENMQQDMAQFTGQQRNYQLIISIVRLLSLNTHPIVVIKLEVNESSANLSSKQLLPTPVYKRK